jgi:hypothetical protein
MNIDFKNRKKINQLKNKKYPEDFRITAFKKMFTAHHLLRILEEVYIISCSK